MVTLTIDWSAIYLYLILPKSRSADEEIPQQLWFLYPRILGRSLYRLVGLYRRPDNDNKFSVYPEVFKNHKYWKPYKYKLNSKNENGI